MKAPWEQERFSFSGPGVAISCEVEYDREGERYVATGSGWFGFSAQSRHAAALNCFKAWMQDEGGYFEGMLPAASPQEQES